jgi:hypothetical protein
MAGIVPRETIMACKTCPNCGAALRLRMFASIDLCMICDACNQGVPAEFLVRSGLPEPLLQKLERWARRSWNITDFTEPGARGPNPDDREYVVMWRDLRGETRNLVAELGRYVEVHAVVVSEVYEIRSPEAWTDEEILRWRHQRQRLKGIGDYGVLIGARHFELGNPRPAQANLLDIEDPEGLRSKEERTTFRGGFLLASIFGSWAEPDQWESEVRRLDAELGMRATKKPSGGKNPPDGC